MKRTVVLEPAINVYSREEFLRRILAVKKKVEIVQFDIIDGLFTGPKNFVDKKIIFQTLSASQVHLHLMVSDIEREVEEWKQYVPKRITCHVENEPEKLEKAFGELKKNKIERGLAIAPATSLAELEPWIGKIDFILLLSVAPGRGGQTFAPTTFDKLKTLRTRYPETRIGVDGGIKESHLSRLTEFGADSVTVGSALFETDASIAIEKYLRILRFNK